MTPQGQTGAILWIHRVVPLVTILSEIAILPPAQPKKPAKMAHLYAIRDLEIEASQNPAISVPLLFSATKSWAHFRTGDLSLRAPLIRG